MDYFFFSWPMHLLCSSYLLYSFLLFLIFLKKWTFYKVSSFKKKSKKFLIIKLFGIFLRNIHHTAFKEFKETVVSSIFAIIVLIAYCVLIYLEFHFKIYGRIVIILLVFIYLFYLFYFISYYNETNRQFLQKKKDWIFDEFQFLDYSGSSNFLFVKFLFFFLLLFFLFFKKINFISNQIKSNHYLD